MSTTTSTVPHTQPKPRRRWWLRGLVAFLLLLFVATTAVYVFTHRSQVSLAEAEAEADRLDPDWRLDALEAKRRVVADADNSALHVIATMKLGKGVSVSGVPNYEVIFDKLTPVAQLNADQERIIRAELGKIVKPLAEARKLKDMPYGRFKITYSPDFISTLIPDHQSSREIADWLMHDAYLLAQEDQPDLALESCMATFNAGRTMGDELFLISHLIRIANQMMGVNAVERVLAQGEATDESLAALQALLAKEIAESTWRQGIRGERAGSRMVFETIRTGKLNVQMLRGLAGAKSSGPVSDWFHEHFPGSVTRFYPEHLKGMNQVIELAKRPLHEQRQPLEEMDRELQSSTNVISRMLSPAYLKVYEADCRSQACLRSTWAALACERYRLMHERWPDSLDALVKAKLIDAIAFDPYDGQPLRMLRTKDGIAVYCVGLDKVDNQGNIDRRQTQTGTDVGIRLWDRGLRRQAPMPLAVVPE
jgi:hypothetical protein